MQESQQGRISAHLERTKFYNAGKLCHHGGPLALAQNRKGTESGPVQWWTTSQGPQLTSLVSRVLDHLPRSLPEQDDHCPHFCPLLLFTYTDPERQVFGCIVLESSQICKSTQIVYPEHRLCGFPPHTAAAFTLLSLLASAVRLLRVLRQYSMCLASF